MSEYESFKTTLMGGFDKDDVITRVEAIKDNASREKKQMEKLLADKEKEIEELSRKLEVKSAQNDRLERDIQEKYQKYIDNYDKISSLVFNAQVQADHIIKDAEIRRDEILKNAEAEAAAKKELAEKEATDRITQVQDEVDEKLAEGKRAYVAVQEEMNEIVDLINQAQRRFMASYKEVHRIVASMPDSVRDLEEETGNYTVSEKNNVTDIPEEEDFDDTGDIFEE